MKPASSSGATRLDYPATPRDEVSEVIFGRRVEDPYRWLEDERDPKVQAWMDAEDKLARSVLTGLPAREGLARRFRELLFVDQLGIPIERGGRLFYLRQRADQNKAILYWREADGPERVLLDPNSWEGGTVSLGAWVPSWDGKKLAFTQRPNAADDAVLHVVDVDTGRWSDAIDGARYASPSWTPEGRGFYYNWLPMDASIPEAERPAFQQIRFHALGSAPATDPVLFGPLKDPTLGLGQDLSQDGEYLFVSVFRGWSENAVWMRRPHEDTAFRPIAQGENARYEVTAWRDRLYITTDEGAPNGRIFVADAAKPERACWRELVPEDAQAAIQSVSLVGGRLAVHALRSASSELSLYALDGTKRCSVALPALGSTSGVFGRPDLPVAYFSFSAFTHPREVRKLDLASGESSVWAKVQLPIEPTRYVTEQVRYESRDGTQVSMFLVHRRDVAPNGQVPTLLYGYGGFNVAMTPDFRASILPLLDAGGLFALANLRGGSEYGEDWHRAGMREKKQNVFDDFAAAAGWLTRAWTTPERLAIQGGSNGGLLVGAALTQQPELCRAVVCQVPLLDMARYHLFGGGRTWIPEYGSPEAEADFPTLLAYSPYHHVQRGVSYPAVLLMSADHDDRVDPMHARKFAAALQFASSGGPVLLRIERHAGHGGADRVDETVNSLADMYSFLFEELRVPIENRSSSRNG